MQGRPAGRVIPRTWAGEVVRQLGLQQSILQRTAPWPRSSSACKPDVLKRSPRLRHPSRSLSPFHCSISSAQLGNRCTQLPRRRHRWGESNLKQTGCEPKLEPRHLATGPSNSRSASIATIIAWSPPTLCRLRRANSSNDSNRFFWYRKRSPLLLLKTCFRPLKSLKSNLFSFWNRTLECLIIPSISLSLNESSTFGRYSAVIRSLNRSFFMYVVAVAS